MSQRSAAQRREQAQKLHGEISDLISTMGCREQWMAYLETASRFTSYSYKNILLILAQCPHAQRVAGYKKWLEHGRQVRKGEKAIRIFGYSTRTTTVTDKSTGEEQTRKVAYFPLVSVFDISQTDTIEGQESSARMPIDDITSDGLAHVDEAIMDYMRQQDWSLTTTSDLPEGVYGVTHPQRKEIRLSAEQNGATFTSTLLHEVAHALLHSQDETMALPTAIKEVEAESVAYIVASALGLDSSAFSMPYIARWSMKDPDLIEHTAKRVVHTAHQLLTVVDNHSNDEAVNAEQAA